MSKKFNVLLLASTALVAAAAFAGSASAQETTAAINGQVRDAAGAPIAGSQVTVLYTPTNETATATTDATGAFTVRGLQPGGPYVVTTHDAAHADKVTTVGALPVGSPYQLTISLGEDANAVSEVVVTAARAPRAAQVGPRSVFTAADIQTLPTQSRDLRDIARLNPFASVDPTNAGALIIAGNNNRYNTVYVDGAKVSDDFGLNANGYPGQRSPISIDIVQSMNVEIAPIDVQYGSFQGGLLNVTSKSGSNEFHGGAFGEFDNNHLGAGSKIRGAKVTFPFNEDNYGFNLSGPIWKDHIFFLINYEKYESSTNASYGPQDDPSAVSKVPGVTAAQVATIQQITQGRYNFNPLGYASNAVPSTDEKWFGKLVWQINNNHRLQFSVQDEVGSTVFTNDDSVSGRNLSLQSDWYSFDQSVRTYTGTLYSKWTPNFSTELTFVRRDVDNISNSLGGNDFANFQIITNTTPQSRLYLGPNISRQANSLTTGDSVLRLRGTYSIGKHTILAGYEREQLDVFNLFVQNANGAYTFNSIADYQAGNAASLTYANAFDNNKNDGAASWGDVIHTFYLQDEWRLRPSLTLKAGIRAEVYEQDARPRFNQYFLGQYGFSNSETLDGLNVVMPRIGLNWTPDRTLSAYIGAGLFSGGNPNVWVSNNYTNTGNLLGQYSVSCATPGAATCSPALLNVSGTQVNAVALAGNAASANAGTGITNALSPSFEPPSVWKFTAGFQKDFNFAHMDLPNWARYASYLGDGYHLHLDYIYQHTNKQVIWKDLLLNKGVVGTAPDGRPVYDLTRFNADPATGRLARSNAYDLVLDSTNRGWGTSVALGGGKTWDWGLDADVTWTHTHVEEVNPATSSVALSNYAQSAFSDANNPGVSISNYNVRDQVKFRLNYRHNWFGDYRTSISLYGTKRSGLPFSYTFDSPASSTTPNDPTFGLAGAVATRDNELLYIPKADASGNVTATSDPIVHFGPNFDLAAFNALLKSTGLNQYAGQISPRNAYNSRSISTFDISFTQEIPTFIPHGSRAEAYFTIFNIGNLIDSSSGIVEQYGFPYFAADVVALNCKTQGASCAGGAGGNFYQYNTFTKKTPTTYTSSSGLPVSLWSLKVGVRYKF